MQAVPKAIAATSIDVAPLEEKLAAEEKKVQESQYAFKFIGAAFSNMASSAFCNPTDIIKVRQELRTQGASCANSFWAVGLEMARTEGVWSLAGGVSASVLREIVYSGIRMGTYEYFKDKIYDATKGALSRDGLALKIAAATVAATICSSLANSADLAYCPNGSPYRSIRNAFASIWQDGAAWAVVAGASPLTGGVRALFKGVVPTTVRGIVLSGTQICSYDQIKQSLKRRGVIQEGIPLHFVPSTFVGFFCSVMSNFVVFRCDQDKGAVDCVRQIMVNGGPFGVFKGFGMCWAGLGTHPTFWGHIQYS